jgi:hypothetical protein
MGIATQLRNVSGAAYCICLISQARRDTGHEALKGHPVYGCAELAGDLDAVIRTPWREVRRRATGSPDTPRRVQRSSVGVLMLPILKPSYLNPGQMMAQDIGRQRKHRCLYRSTQLIPADALEGTVIGCE